MAKQAVNRNPYSPQAMRGRFHALRREIEAIEAKTAPLRDKRDALQADLDKIGDKMKDLAAEIRAVEDKEDLHGKKQELSMLVRALGGKTGNPNGSMPATTGE